MKLVEPTDFEILSALADGRRNNAVNLAHQLDKNRSYVNTRLPVLQDYGLIDRVGPAPNSGLYEITDKGRAVLQHRDVYSRDKESFVEEVESSLSANA